MVLITIVTGENLNQLTSLGGLTLQGFLRIFRPDLRTSQIIETAVVSILCLDRNLVVQAERGSACAWTYGGVYTLDKEHTLGITGIIHG